MLENNQLIDETLNQIKKEGEPMNHDLKNRYHIAVPTAFYEDESLNVADTIEHIIYLQNLGVGSVLVCGSTGEQHSLTLSEKISILDGIEKEDRFENGFEIIFGVSSIRQKEALALALKINTLTKISGILLGFPPYILPSQKEAVIYAQTIIQSLNKPVIIYNNPKRTGFDLSITSFIDIANHKNVIGMKEAGDSERIPHLLATMNKKIAIYAGGETSLKEKVALGFNRLSSVAGNLYPLEIEKWFELLLAESNQDFPQQKELDKIYENSPLTYLKNAISTKESLSMGKPRSPLGNET